MVRCGQAARRRVRRRRGAGARRRRAGAASAPAVARRSSARFDDLQQRVDRERLLDEVEGAELGRLHRGLDVAVAGDHDDRRTLGRLARMRCAAARCRRPPASRRRAITSSRRARCASSSSARAPVLRLEHAQPSSRQHAAQRVADLVLVVDHQDRVAIASSPPRLAPYALAAAAQLRGRPPHRELDHEADAARRVVAHADEAWWSATIADTIASPSPVPSFLVEKYGSKSARLHLRRHAGAVVGDLEPHHAERGVVARPQLDAARARRRAGRRAAQAATALSSMLITRALDRRRDRSRPAAASRPASNSKAMSRCASRKSTSASSTSAFRSCGACSPAGRRAKVENSFTRRFSSSTCCDDRARALVEERAVRRASCARVALAQALRRELDRRERVLDLVRDAARHLAPRLHALDAQQDA